VSERDKDDAARLREELQEIEAERDYWKEEAKPVIIKSLYKTPPPWQVWTKRLIAIVALVVPLIALWLILKPVTEPVSVIVPAKASKSISKIPESGAVLGNADAPAKINVYADLNSSDSRKLMLRTLPSLYDSEVATGQLKLVYRPLQTDKRSKLAAQALVAAGKQNKLWPLATVLYRNHDKLNRNVIRTAARVVDMPQMDQFISDIDQTAGELKQSNDTQPKIVVKTNNKKATLSGELTRKQLVEQIGRLRRR
jgi:hypothetical protein